MGVASSWGPCRSTGHLGPLLLSHEPQPFPEVFPQLWKGRFFISRCLQNCVQCLCFTAPATLQPQQPALEEEMPCLGTAGLSQWQAGGGHAYWDPRSSAGAFKLLRLYMPLPSQAVKGLEKGWVQQTLTDLFPGSGPVLGSGDMEMMMRLESS